MVEQCFNKVKKKLQNNVTSHSAAVAEYVNRVFCPPFHLRCNDFVCLVMT